MANKNRFIAMMMAVLTCFSLCAHTDDMVEKGTMATDGIVRLSKIEVYPQYLDEYMGFAVEVGAHAYRTGSAQIIKSRTR